MDGERHRDVSEWHGMICEMSGVREERVWISGPGEQLGIVHILSLMLGESTFFTRRG